MSLTKTLVLTLCIAATVPYGNTLGNDFVYDDIQRIVENRIITSWDNWLVIVTSTTRPIRNLTFLVDYSLWGLDSAGWHVTNILLHVCVTLLVFFVLDDLLSRFSTGGGERLGASGHRWVAWGAALLFAAHPVNTEAVTNVSNRQEMLMSIFLLSSLLLYSRGTWVAYVASLVALALAIGSKQFAIIGPGLWVVRDIWCEPGSPRTVLRRRFPRYVPIVLLGALLSTRVPFQLPQVPLWEEPASTVFFTASWAFQYYLGLLVWPANLSADVYTPFRDRPDASIILAWVLLVSILVVTLRGYRRRTVLGLSCAMFLVAWLPFSNVRPAVHVVAERYLYFPSIWMLLALSWLAYGLASARLRPGATVGRLGVFAALVIVLSCLYTARTLDRNRDWRTAESLWKATIATDPLSFTAHYNLGNHLSEQGKLQEAIGHQRYSVALAPESAAARNNLGLSLLRSGEYEEARAVFEEALEIDPLHMTALFNLACVFSRQGRLEEAYECLALLKKQGRLPRPALREDPDLVDFRASDFYERLVGRTVEAVPSHAVQPQR